MFEAKQHFSEIINAVNTQNETCIISKSGKEVAMITPLHRVKTRKLGVSKGKFFIPENFGDPLPDEIVDAFYTIGYPYIIMGESKSQESTEKYS